MEKIAFVVCYNNELYMRECMDYISWLKVPENIETEIIGIKDADSMAAGYNAAMHDSDARYKVYLHQDVFILNEDFIYDVIEVFKTYPEYGMLGVIGSDRVIADANYWLGWNVGECYANDSMRQQYIKFRNPVSVDEVHAIDGLLMITQYDVEWHEDVFDGFDFYDISQSMEFKKRGYKIGVPHQKKVWCNHVCGQTKLEKYDIYRKKFCDEYQKYGYGYQPNTEIDDTNDGNLKTKQVLPVIKNLFNNRFFGLWNKVLYSAFRTFQYNTELDNMVVINQVMQMEFTQNIENGFYNTDLSYDEAIRKLCLFRFLLFRLEYGKPVESMQEIFEMVIKCDLRSIKKIAESTVFDFDHVKEKIKIGRAALEDSLPLENNIVYCVPTCNHPEVIEDVLTQAGKVYAQMGMDVYIYDSSDNKKTYWIVKHFIDQGMDHLHYVEIDPSISLDEKLIMIFQGYGLKKKYKYLWMVKDRVLVPQNTLEIIKSELSGEYDIIFCNTFDGMGVSSEIKQVYEDAGEFYNVAGKNATSMNTTIYHYDKVLKNIDWDDFRKRYFFNGENQFDHFTVLFHAIGIKQDIKVRFLYGKEIQFMESYWGKSGWTNRVFEIWGDLWLKVNEALPECYDKYKQKVIKEVTSLPWIFGSEEMLIILRDKGIFTPEVYEYIKNRWGEISTVPLETVQNIVYKWDEGKRQCTFWDKADYLLKNGNHPELYTHYYEYGWMRDLDEDGRYIILGECIKVYYIESQQRTDKSILDEEKTIESVIQKYMTVKYLLQRIEYDIEQGKSISEYVRWNHISSHFLTYIAGKYCQNPENVLQKFIDILDK